ncbi:MAG: helix-turn-helix transcriptional regulator [Bacilli bacterium]|nr:helix-turn-helix transcriptional regulator [Bacilli bacterium]
MKKLSKELIKYQKAHRYTYEHLAKELSLSKSAVYAYTKGLRNPSWKTLEKIAKKINKNILSLIDDFDYESDIKLLDALKKDPTTYEYLLKNSKTILPKIKKMISNK